MKQKAVDVTLPCMSHPQTIFRRDRWSDSIKPWQSTYPRQEGRRPSYMIIHVDADGKMDYQQKYL